METRYDFRLDFLTDQNMITRINLPRANTVASGNDVFEAMRRIIGSNVVRTRTGDLVSPQAAGLITTTRRDFVLA